MADSLANLREKTQYLRNAASIEFDAFRTAFNEYTDDLPNKLVEATNNLKQIQGQIQQCHLLRKMFRELK